ncbi:uncharacterized protein LOC105277901 isoform X2 [Ooceraea biroi]|uniref:Membrane protein FAM174 n=1 Tax=Ooceraea biroi TaxID=2015173 RepID=A0A026WMQ1_OOCBI|nr:uncharacterized protein LOC105277901 isoform X2 [Ooceraea biroi]EZA56936.1 hypothetical protein X777_02787 [Ooceraea biroi]
MTRSKIQEMKFFVFLLIFLLAQTAVCDGSSREKRDAPLTAAGANKTASLLNENKGADVRSNKQPSTAPSPVRKDGRQNPAGSSTNANKPPVDGNKTHDDITSKSSTSDVANKTAHTANTSNESSEGHTTFNTGALIRGFLVFVGLSILVMAYIVFRSFRLSKTRAQLVRKYGILAHRQDVEMRPLPLEEEDDEDTTVFDASNVVTTNVQHQNA